MNDMKLLDYQIIKTYPFPGVNDPRVRLRPFIVSKAGFPARSMSKLLFEKDSDPLTLAEDELAALAISGAKPATNPVNANPTASRRLNEASSVATTFGLFTVGANATADATKKEKMTVNDNQVMMMVCSRSKKSNLLALMVPSILLVELGSNQWVTSGIEKGSSNRISYTEYGRTYTSIPNNKSRVRLFAVRSIPNKSST